MDVSGHERCEGERAGGVAVGASLGREVDDDDVRAVLGHDAVAPRHHARSGEHSAIFEHDAVDAPGAPKDDVAEVDADGLAAKRGHQERGEGAEVGDTVPVGVVGQSHGVPADPEAGQGERAVVVGEDPPRAAGEADDSARQGGAGLVDGAALDAARGQRRSTVQR